MLIMTANASGRDFHRLQLAHRQPHTLGWLIGPASLPKTSLRHRIPFALDNDAFSAFCHGTPWNAPAWREMLKAVWQSALDPLWLLVPDVVADRDATLQNWRTYSPEAAACGWPLAFAVQDGMTANDVPREADVVFIGGSTAWKWRTLQYWCDNFRRVHVGRVNTTDRLELCHASGAESCDGTGWMRRGAGDRQRRNSWRDLETFLDGTYQQPWFGTAGTAHHPPVCSQCNGTAFSFDTCADCGADTFTTTSNKSAQNAIDNFSTIGP